MRAENKVRTINIAIDQRLFRAEDGSTWTQSPPSYDFFQRALSVFHQVQVIARTTKELPAGQLRRVDGPGVEVIALPCYQGPWQYAKERNAVLRAVRKAADLPGAFLLRIPSQTGFLLAEELERKQRSYAVDLLTDPDQFFSAGVTPHSLALFFRPWFASRCRTLCAHAKAVNYITGKRTRKNYPAKTANWSSSLSDVDLPPSAFLPIVRSRQRDSLRIISVGFLDLLYKGQDLLLRALGDCHRSGLKFHMIFAGDGANREHLLSLAESLGIREQVRITGALAGAAAVREHLESSDLFVLPSRAEGIPRALLEAMAAGLPAITSDVGAMPDLIDPRWVVPAGSTKALAAKILEFSRIPKDWAAIGAANQERSRAFATAVLEPEWRKFFRAIQQSASFAKGIRTEYANAV